MELQGVRRSARPEARSGLAAPVSRRDMQADREFEIRRALRQIERVEDREQACRLSSRPIRGPMSRRGRRCVGNGGRLRLSGSRVGC
jgi:hypothetical protein